MLSGLSRVAVELRLFQVWGLLSWQAECACGWFRKQLMGYQYICTNATVYLGPMTQDKTTSVMIKSNLWQAHEHYILLVFFFFFLPIDNCKDDCSAYQYLLITCIMHYSGCNEVILLQMVPLQLCKLQIWLHGLGYQQVAVKVISY